MAEKKFSELTAKGATIADTDIVAISESAGGGTYTSKSVTGANIKALVTDANMTTTDITTNDVSTSKHGFAPKAPNDTTKFLRGDATWAVVPAGGLTNFTEAEATTSPNNTVYVDSLTAAGSTTNVDVAIVPKGSGAFMLDIPDNTATGGNKRGTNAVDLQTSRNANDQVASGNNSFVAGQNNRAAGSNSVTIGTSCAATGSNSVTIGTSCTASGQESLALGRSSTSSNFQSLVLGAYCTASGQESLALGNFSLSSGTYSHTLGRLLTASAPQSTAIGHSCTANANNSFATGVSSHVFGVWGRLSYSGRQIGTSGDCQKSTFILGERTTNNTAKTLITGAGVGGGTAGSDNQVILSNQSAYRFKGTIIGKQSGSTNTSAWDVDGLIVRGANAAATTLIVSNVNVVDNTPTFGTPTLAADTTNGGLQIQVTGAAATNIQWTAVIETTEVIYA